MCRAARAAVHTVILRAAFTAWELQSEGWIIVLGNPFERKRLAPDRKVMDELTLIRGRTPLYAMLH
jgi:hypothetical protein